MLTPNNDKTAVNHLVNFLYDKRPKNGRREVSTVLQFTKNSWTSWVALDNQMVHVLYIIETVGTNVISPIGTFLFP